jgi:hypothetical protein
MDIRFPDGRRLGSNAEAMKSGIPATALIPGHLRSPAHAMLGASREKARGRARVLR